jgi:TorA maturation chaperone TorD
MADTAVTLAPDPLDEARANEYALLAALLARSPGPALLQRLSRLPGDTTRLGLAHTALAAAAARAEPDLVAREYHDLFVGLARGELLPYASYYLAGSLHGRPLARLRATMRQLCFVPAELTAEPEDHAATVLELMTAVAASRPEAARTVFDAHVASWMPRFFGELETAGSADFYRSVAALGRTFLAIETDAFILAGDA